MSKYKSLAKHEPLVGDRAEASKRLARREVLQTTALGGLAAVVSGCKAERSFRPMPKPDGFVGTTVSKKKRAKVSEAMQTRQAKILKTVELGMHWPTLDPFLFCAHHRDAYPRGNEQFGPAVSLAGRNIGSDFSVKDGFSMYHGDVVPGFPQHPHRGFETVTLARSGYVDHADSLGATARYGNGDVQWMTAGKGIVHAEMFPLLAQEQENPLEIFQIWLNLPAADKMTEPHFKMLWNESVPRHLFKEGSEPAARITTVAGALNGKRPPSPAPKSWAAREANDVAVWLIELEAGARWTLPATQSGATRMLYFYQGSAARVAGHPCHERSGLQLESSAPALLEAPQGACSFLLLQGRPIRETVAHHGPFVMNRREELVQAFEDYRRTQFGGWPWQRNDPTHARDAGRFAAYPSGKVDKPASG